MSDRDIDVVVSKVPMSDISGTEISTPARTAATSFCDPTEMLVSRLTGPGECEQESGEDRCNVLLTPYSAFFLHPRLEKLPF